MRRLALALVIVAVCGIAPAAEAVVIPGPNGPLVFTSARNDGATVFSNPKAQIWFLSGPGGGAVRLSTLELSHYRHPSWSPDRTKIAYARGAEDPDFNGPWDIFVQDLTAPGSAPIQVTNTLTNEDRPSWSPDGTRLAYAKQDAIANWDVVTKLADGTGAETFIADLTSTGAQASGQFTRPQWSPDGQTIYYGRIITVTPQDYDIYRAAADGSNYQDGNPNTGTPLVVGPTNDYQPALAPDGDNLCFTRQGATKDIAVAPSIGGAGAVLIAESGDEYECAWSPDDSKIAFVRGAFGAGEIRVKDLESDALSTSATNDTDGPGGAGAKFDGNPDWTRNPPPSCSNGNASVAFNGFVRIPLTCTDDLDPPFFQPPDLELDITTPPANGTLSGIQPDRSVIYTPNANFSGTDTFSFTGNDQATTSPPATITVNVGPGPPPDVKAPVITDVSVFPRRWRRGTRLPRFSARVGTRIRWRLDETARVTLSFRRKRGSRFVRVRPALTRPNARAGLNTLRFQGKLNRRKRLRLGTYRVVIGAVDAAGNRSSRTSRTFRIVAR